MFADRRELERMILGAALENRQAAGIVATTVQAAWLTSSGHRAVLDAIGKVWAGNGEVDEVAVCNQLQIDKRLDDAGGKYAIRQLCESAGLASQLRTYMGQLQVMARLDSVQRLGTQIREVASTETDPDLVDAQVAQLFGQHLGTSTSSDGHTPDTLWVDMIEEYERVDPWRIHMPIPSLNSCGGWRPGMIGVVGGYTKHGKTWWAIDQAETALIAGHPTAYFTFEMSAQEIYQRLHAMRGSVYEHVVDRAVPVHAMMEAAETISQWPLTVFDRRCGVGGIEAEVMRARLRGKPFRLVIVDHIHLMPMDGRDYRVAFNDAMARLKDLAKREGIVLILLAQLGRQKGKVTYGGETFETTQPVPKLSYYRESSALEQIADIAMFVYRFPNQLDKPSKEAWIMVAGQRDGRPIKDVRATWSEVSYRFQPTDPADMVPPPPVFTQQAMA